MADEHHFKAGTEVALVYASTWGGRTISKCTVSRVRKDGKF